MLHAGRGSLDLLDAEVRLDGENLERGARATGIDARGEADGSRVTKK